MSVSNEVGEGQMSPEDMTPEQFMSALFAHMVVQNSNMALMFLGKVPHPQTGQPVKDLESAQMFIDQLEMIAFKTRGNLDNEEKQLLQQSLISLRMAFVEELRKAGIPVPDHLTQQSQPAVSAPIATPVAPKTAASALAPASPAPEPIANASTPPPSPTPAPSSTSAPAQAAAAAPAEEESRKRFSKKY